MVLLILLNGLYINCESKKTPTQSFVQIFPTFHKVEKRDAFGVM